MTFVEQLRALSRKNDSLLCVGLDPDPRLLPEAIKGGAGETETDFLRFNKAIIEQTADLVCAYKLNLAFYLAGGTAGLEALQQTIRYVTAETPVILDLKCGDVGHTAQQYARACFETYGCHAVTVNPLMGRDALAPFLQYEHGCTFVLCLTSNPGAADFELQAMADGKPLYRYIATRIAEWAVNGNCGAVVAPVDVAKIQELRTILPDIPFLMPGIGAQGLDLEAAVRQGTNQRGELAILNVSRHILYASSAVDFAEAARRAAKKYQEEINRYR